MTISTKGNFARFSIKPNEQAHVQRYSLFIKSNLNVLIVKLLNWVFFSSEELSRIVLLAHDNGFHKQQSDVCW